VSVSNLTGVELTALNRRDALSPVEVARDCLCRIAAKARFNALMSVEPGPVLEAARSSEARWPGTHKDN
jgi:Asp-tRNA(Asn)/Glu-tRNA(Gln) amidotransferase A subunit family amidase